MTKKFDSFDNLEASMRKTSVIQERINLVSTHMYKQFLEYEQAAFNTQETFVHIIENTKITIDYLKRSFAGRGVVAQKINYEFDKSNAVLILDILWHTISFTAKFNDKPQALYREGQTPVFTGRIIAMKGNYSSILSKNPENEIQKVLEHEVASLYIPADKSTPAIIKINHLGNREFYISQIEAPREFLLKVIEIICGGGIYHEESIKKL